MTIESALQELIKKVSATQSQIDNLVHQVKTLENQKVEAREETKHSLLQLQQLQEEFEQLYLADQEKKIETAAREERVLTLEGELSKLKGERDARAKDATEAQREAAEAQREAAEAKREAAEAKREAVEAKREAVEAKREVEELKPHLDQMQEELEHQFQSNQQQIDMLNIYASQEERFQNILHKILHSPLPSNASEAKA